MKKVLLTGASGFLGRPCASILAASGYEVHALSSSNFIGRNEKIFWHQIDLLNDDVALQTLMAKVQPTHLLHLAWCPAIPGKYWDDADNFRWVQASLRLFEEFTRHDGKRIVSVGTCAEYDWNYGFCSEGVTPLQPETVYGQCKHALQILLQSYAHKIKISAAWGRPFFLYGPGEYSGRLVASVVRALLDGEKATCSHGEQIRDFLHVEDAAAALVALLESEVCGPVNIASGQPVAVKEVVEQIADLMGHRALLEFGAKPESLTESPLLVADVRRLQNEVGWQPRYNLTTGLENTIAWWKNADQTKRNA